MEKLMSSTPSFPSMSPFLSLIQIFLSPSPHNTWCRPLCNHLWSLSPLKNVMNLDAEIIVPSLPGFLGCPIHPQRWCYSGPADHIWRTGSDQVTDFVRDVVPEVMVPERCWVTHTRSVTSAFLYPKGCHVDVKCGMFCADPQINIKPKWRGTRERDSTPTLISILW